MLNENKPKDLFSGKQEKQKTVVNAVKLDPETPIPLDVGSSIYTILSGQKYLPFLGDYDNMANVFWDARLLSLTHDACISSIASTCVGQGLMITNVEEDKVDKDFIKFIANINSEESLNDLVNQGIDALHTDGNAWIEIVRGQVGGEKYVRAYLYTTLECRFAEPPKGKEKPEDVLKSRGFREPRTKMISTRSLKAVTIPLYSSNELDQPKVWSNGGNNDQHTMLHLKCKYGALPFYGLPPSRSSLRQQLLEGKGAQYNLDNFENNMVLSAMLIFKSAMTQEEAAANGKQIIKAHTGAGKQGRIAVLSSEGGIDDFDYKALDTNKEGSYIELDKRLEEKIINSHKWDKVFFANGGEGNLGKGSGYVRAVYEVKKTTVIDPIIKYWIDHFIKPLVNIAADHLGKQEWKKYEFAFDSAMPFSYSSDIDVNSVITKNEGREILGWSKVTDAKGNPDPKWEEPIKNSSPKTDDDVQNKPA